MSAIERRSSSDLTYRFQLIKLLRIDIKSPTNRDPLLECRVLDVVALEIANGCLRNTGGTGQLVLSQTFRDSSLSKSLSTREGQRHFGIYNEMSIAVSTDN